MPLFMKKILLLVTFFSLGLSTMQAQPTGPIDRVEPLCWWVGMENPKLQLMFYGKGIASYTPSINYEGVTLGSVSKTENVNYLFLNLTISKTAKPGKMTISFTSGKKRFSYEYSLYDRKPRDGRQVGLSTSDVVYLIMPDRFANGNTANDSIPGYPDKYSRSNPNGRHGGDLQGIVNHLDYLQNLGVTALWLTPFQENNEKVTSYHGYGMTDYYKVDPRFGSNDDYRNFVAAAHKHGLKVIMDVVFNQVGFENWMFKDKPSGDWFNEFPTYTQTNFMGTTIHDPNASVLDRKLMVDGWFTQSMPDLNQSNPLVENYLDQFVTWWVEYANLDAIRFDTYQYNDKDMLARWAKQLRAEYPNIFIFAEVWVNSVAITSAWQEHGSNRNYESHVQSVVDFPLNDAINSVFVRGNSIRDIYSVLSEDFLYYNPKANVVFFDNHDLDRMFTLVGEDLNKMEMATALLLTTRGIPQLYYGDELLMTGAKHPTGDGYRRKDFPGGWATDSVNAFTPEGRTGLSAEYFNYLNKLLLWRKANGDLMAGKMVQFIPENEVYVYFREAGDKTAMVVINNNDHDVSLDLSRFSEVLFRYGEGRDVITDKVFQLNSPMPLVKRSATVLMLR